MGERPAGKRVNFRQVKDVRSTTSRKAGWSLAQSYIDPPPRNASGFLNSSFLTWVIQYLRVAFSPRHSFPVYTAPVTDKPGIFPMNDTCRVALVGDWGTGTESAYRVMDSIRYTQKPNVTIHLGDIYYSGLADEANSYFLGPDDWYRAERSFALNGNHEMYSGGAGYFDRVLPALNQETSYFCIENNFWRIVAVDTGYGTKVFPFLDLFVAPSVQEENLRWLASVVFADSRDRRPVILLSHHQWFSSFDKGCPKVGRQLRPFLSNVALWFWGHEHRFAGYAPYAPDGGSAVRARCIGHGGMPVEIAEPSYPEVPVVFADDRESDQKEDPPIGFCGNALLEFSDAILRVRYFDEHETELFAEEWESGEKAGGGVKGRIVFASKNLNWYGPVELLVQ